MEENRKSVREMTHRELEQTVKQFYQELYRDTMDPPTRPRLPVGSGRSWKRLKKLRENPPELERLPFQGSETSQAILQASRKPREIRPSKRPLSPIARQPIKEEPDDEPIQ